MTRLTALIALFWFALCFFFLDASASAMAREVLPTAAASADDLDEVRIRFLLYTIVPLCLWLIEALRADARSNVQTPTRAAILHK